jgi:hypothetical protein
MAASTDFIPIWLSGRDEKIARKKMREMLGRNWWRLRGRAAWAGFAAETAIFNAVNMLQGPMWCRMAEHFDHDLTVGQGVESLKASERGEKCSAARVEVKTRAVPKGWIHPEKFQYVTIPMHEDREPIKDVELVWFCWYSMSLPRTLWVLGYCRGLAEFKRRAVWYGPGEPLPRGGWAKGGGAYTIDIKDLRPMPEGLLKEKT